MNTIGINCAHFRKLAGLTQTDLAYQMTERGLSFHTTTITKIEKGIRALRLDEANVMAPILGITLEDLCDCKAALNHREKVLMWLLAEVEHTR